MQFTSLNLHIYFQLRYLYIFTRQLLQQVWSDRHFGIKSTCYLETKCSRHLLTLCLYFHCPFSTCSNGTRKCQVNIQNQSSPSTFLSLVFTVIRAMKAYPIWIDTPWTDLLLLLLLRFVPPDRPRNCSGGSISFVPDWWLHYRNIPAWTLNERAICRDSKCVCFRRTACLHILKNLQENLYFFAERRGKRCIMLIIIIISLGQIVLSYKANTHTKHTQTPTRTRTPSHTRAHTHTYSHTHERT